MCIIIFIYPNSSTLSLYNSVSPVVISCPYSSAAQLRKRRANAVALINQMYHCRHVYITILFICAVIGP